MSRDYPIVLPADIYDTLELAALAFGGVGDGRDFEFEKGNSFALDWNAPCCIHGLALFAEDHRTTGDERMLGCVSGYLLGPASIGRLRSDFAVRRIIQRTKTPRSKVSFAEWCNELNVVRGS